MSTQMDGYLGAGILGYWAFPTTSTFTDGLDIRAGADTFDSFVFSLPQDGIIKELGLFIVEQPSTGTNAGGYEVALKTLTGAGLPDTVNYGGSSGTVFTISDFELGWNWIELSEHATGTVGDIVALTIKEITSDANNYIGTANYYTPPIEFNLPRRQALFAFTTASPIMAVRYTDGLVYGRPLRQFTSDVFDSADDPDEVGAKIYPFAQVTCNGVVFTPRPNGAFTILLYDSADSEIASVSVTDRDHAFRSLNYPAILHWDDVVLSSGTFYRLTVRSDSPTNTSTVCGYTFITGSYKYTVDDGMNWSRTYRTDGGSWTDDDDSVPHLGLVLNNITLGGGENGNGDTTGTSSTSYYGWA